MDAKRDGYPVERRLRAPSSQMATFATALAGRDDRAPTVSVSATCVGGQAHRRRAAVFFGAAVSEPAVTRRRPVLASTVSLPILTIVQSGSERLAAAPPTWARLCGSPGRRPAVHPGVAPPRRPPGRRPAAPARAPFIATKKREDIGES